jgi:methyltransferase (TIGR00027 family)
MRPGETSSTALLIAVSAVHLSKERRYAELVRRDEAEQAAAVARVAGGWAARLVRWSAFAPVRRASRALERAMLPGIQVHFRARKRVIEATVRRGLDEGFGQLVVVGAGFDWLLTTLAREGVAAKLVELDLPTNQAIKRRALEQTGGVPPGLTMVPVDLARTDLDEALRQVPREAGFDPSAPTLFVAEGLLMYLSVDQVRRFFRGAVRVSAKDGASGRRARTRVVCTVMRRKLDGDIKLTNMQRVLVGWLNRVGEPFKWGIPLDELGPFLAEFGLAPRRVWETEALRATLEGTGAAGATLVEGEVVVEAE